MERRKFIEMTAKGGLGILAGVSLASCNQPKMPTEPLAPTAHSSHHDALDAFRENNLTFVEQTDGEKADTEKAKKPVRFDDLAQWIGNRCSTVSFQFTSCGDGVCQRITNDLTDLSATDASVRHIVISTKPFTDYISGGLLWERLKAQGLTEENTKVLFPVGEGNDIFEKLKNGRHMAALAQQAVGLPTMGDDADHSPEVFAYNAEGQFLPDNSSGQGLDTYSYPTTEQFNTRFQTLVRNDSLKQRSR